MVIVIQRMFMCQLNGVTGDSMLIEVCDDDEDDGG